MKKIFALAGVLVALCTSGQDCKNYYFLQNNKTVEMTIYNKKGGSEAKLVYLISEVKNSGNATMATVQSEMFDKKGKSISKGSSVMKCNGGIMMINMKLNLPQQQTEQFTKANVKIEDVYMEYPTAMKTGDQLKDGNLSMDMDNSGMKQSLTMTISDRKVEGEEKITTAAGTWDCYKISFKNKMIFKIMGAGIPMNMDGTEWYAPGFGVVKSQNKHGITEITSVK